MSEAGYLTTESSFPPGVRNFKAYRNAAVHMAIAYARAYDALKRTDRIKADSESSFAADVGLIHNVIRLNL